MKSNPKTNRMKNNNNSSNILIPERDQRRLSQLYGAYTDQQLVAAARLGNHDAGAYLCFVANAAIFYSVANRMHFGHDRDQFVLELRDTVWDELCNGGWAKMAGHSGHIGSYLYGIVRNSACRLLDVLGNRHRGELTEILFHDVRSCEDDPYDVADDVDFYSLYLEALDKCLDKLSPAERYLIDSRFFQGLTLAEIGHQMPREFRPAEYRPFAKDLPESKVRDLFKEVTAKLRKEIEFLVGNLIAA